MIKTKIIDNWLEPDLVKYLNEYFLYSVPHYYGHSSNNDRSKSCFYASGINQNDPLNDFLFQKLRQSLNLNLNLIRMYINVQHKDMDGDYHTDDGDSSNITCLYMVTKTLNNSGYFEIKNEEKIDFKQNRLICFDSKKEHRGLAPIETGDVRITLAFKTYVD